MRKFIELANSNAIAKAYEKHLDMNLEDIKIHIKLLPYYGLYIELADKVIALQKERVGATQEKKNLIRSKILQVQDSYKQKLANARSLADE